MIESSQEYFAIPLEPYGVLKADGTLQKEMYIDETPDLLLEMYRWMTFGRFFDTRLINLQRQGRLLTYPPIAGQEAIQVGSALALQQEDWLFGSYRDGLASVIHGLPPEHVIFFFRGHPKAGKVPRDVNVVGFQVGVGEHIPHAVGAAWGMKLCKAQTAALVLFGDGATSEGAFHEGMNFAGVFQIPVVLICQNNGWAISVPRSQQTASKTLAQKALAYGICGRLIDGNDVIAVHREVSAALERARTGKGSTFIEAVTYRLGPHSTADDPKRYQLVEELIPWRTIYDPIMRLRTYLEYQGQWNETKQKILEEEIQERIACVVSSALTEPLPPAEILFDHVYATLSPLLALQQKALVEHVRAFSRGDSFP